MTGQLVRDISLLRASLFIKGAELFGIRIYFEAAHCINCFQWPISDTAGKLITVNVNYPNDVI